ncbi:MAG: hypothetical protein IJI66_08790 [Erysipelotrichaceae bacterium]|nr:hypothetical protein [Erysipelotrichaceae bacterium]
MQENKEKKNSNILTIILAVALVIVVILLMLKSCQGNGGNAGGGTVTPTPVDIDENQGVYVKPETPIDRSKNVTLPGWGSFTIPKDTTHIDKGFEFHNPEQNTWYEVSISYGGSALEKLIVDSGNVATAEHYAKLANIRGEKYEFKSWNENYFNVTEEEGVQYISAIGPFEGEEEIVIAVDGQEYTFKVNCSYELYYMTFALYLDNGGENDELLYESGLVKPGNYIQTMDISRALSAGSYKAYVYIQPYRSDKVSKTNTGKVVIDLNVG